MKRRKNINSVITEGMKKLQKENREMKLMLREARSQLASTRCSLKKNTLGLAELDSTYHRIDNLLKKL